MTILFAQVYTVVIWFLNINKYLIFLVLSFFAIQFFCLGKNILITSRSSFQSHRRRRGFALDPERQLRPGRTVTREQLAKFGVADTAGQSRWTAREDQADPGGG